MPKSAIEKQAHNKYDNKQRKSQEKKTERLSLRISKEIKAKLIKLQQETNLSQGSLLESLISSNHLTITPNASLIANELAEVSQQLNNANIYLRQGNNGLAVEQLRQSNNTFNNIQNLLLQALGGIGNGNL